MKASEFIQLSQNTPTNYYRTQGRIAQLLSKMYYFDFSGMKEYDAQWVHASWCEHTGMAHAKLVVVVLKKEWLNVINSYKNYGFHVRTV